MSQRRALWWMVLGLAVLLPHVSTEAANERQASSAPITHDGPYVPGQFIVKYKPSLTQCAHCLFALKRSFRQATAHVSSTDDTPPSLDELHHRFGVTRITPLFRTEADEYVLKAKQSSTTPVSLSALQAARTSKVNAVRQRYSTRAARAPRDAAIPDLNHIYLIEVSPDADIEQMAREYAADPNVEYAQPNWRVVANKPLDLQTRIAAYPDPWGSKKLQIKQAWDRTQGEGVVVAVVDSGIDYTHPNLAQNIWVNPCEDLNHNGLPDQTDYDGRDDACPGQAPNRYPDDVIGWNFYNRDNDPNDESGHGTAIAGIISSINSDSTAVIGPNNTGIVGVAPKAKVMAVKYSGKEGENGDTSTVAQGMVYAADNGADVINGSWLSARRCSDTPVLEDAVRTAHEQGAVLVFGAGNDPAANVASFCPQGMTDPKPIVVAATTFSDARASFSSFGAQVDIGAPGVNILSTKPTQVTPSGTEYYAYSSGTSFSAPFASGVAALLLARRPDLTNDDVRNVLRDSADDIGAPGFDVYTGAGRLNAARALQSIDRPPTLGLILDQTAIAGKLLRFTVQASDPDGDRLTYAMTNAPPHATVDPATGLFRFTPDASQVGIYRGVTFTVTDPDAMSASMEITITVEPLWGDLNGNGQVTVDELVRAVHFALGTLAPSPAERSRLDYDRDGRVTVVDLGAAVNNALTGPEARQVDRNGNGTVEGAELQALMARAQAPYVRILAPAANTLIAQNLISAAQVTAAGRIATVRFSLNNNLVSELAAPNAFNDTYLALITPAQLHPGANTLTVTATDASGGVGEASVVVRREAGD